MDGRQDVTRWLIELPQSANSGDIYAVGRLSGHCCSARFLMVSAAVLVAVGFGLTLLIFYPGVMTYDAKFVYEDIAKGTYGDWQSPVMVWLWGLIDPIAPGAASMFLLTAATYWLGFGVLSLVLASRGRASALLLPLLAMTPPALAFAGIIWRDVLFATCWLLAAAVAFAASEQRSPDQVDRAGTGACTGYPWDAVETERLASPRRSSRLISFGYRGSPCARRRSSTSRP